MLIPQNGALNNKSASALIKGLITSNPWELEVNTILIKLAANVKI
jgi:hypothetical protein